MCEELHVKVAASENSGDSTDGGGGDPLSTPTESFTIAEAAAYMNRSGGSWNNGALNTPTTLTYAFRNTDATYSHTDQGTFTRFNAEQIAAGNMALQSWADVANLTFTRVTGSGPNGAYSDNATILLGNLAGGGGYGAYAYLPNNPNGSRAAGNAQGDVFVNSDIKDNLNPEVFGYGVSAVTHELGHSLAFLHPGDYNGNGITYDSAAEFIEDTRMYSIMSYFSEAHTGGDFNGFYPAAPMMIDIAAAQRLYGANLSFNTGATTYGFNSNAGRDWYEATAEQPPIFCAWDAGGVDTFDFSGYAVKQTIDLRNEAFSSVGGMKFNVSVSSAVKVDNVIVNTIENAIGGSAVDTIIGNKGNNTLEGRAGNDTLLAGKGNDALLGGDGNDQLVGGVGMDTITGGLGQDLMTGQKHNDRFVFNSINDSMVGTEDRIYGGLTRLDYIDLSGIDADTTTAGNQAFHFGGNTFDSDAGELIRFYHAGSNTTFIQGDIDGDDDADFSIAVTGDYTTHAAFVL